jgi:succinyl-CoA synthetase alpha subunit
MGHAGSWSSPGEGSALDKWRLLEEAGVIMVDHPAKFGNVMKRLLDKSQSGRITVSTDLLVEVCIE